MARRGRDAVYSRPTPLRQQLRNQKNIAITEVLPKEQGVLAPHWAPQPRILHREYGTPQNFCFENQWGLCSRKPESCRKQSALKGHVQNLTHSKSQCRGSSLKGAWFRPTCCSWRVSQRRRRQLGFHLRMKTLVAATLWSSFHHDVSTGKCRSGILPLAH